MINEEWILTVAHCIVPYNYSVNDLGVGVGNEHDLVKIFDKRLPIKKIIIPNDYDPTSGSSTGDLALLQLTIPLQFNRTVSPACILKRDVRPYEGELVVTGWGSTQKTYMDAETGQKWGRKVSRWLKKADFVDSSLVSHLCSDRSDLVCVASVNQKDSTCNGDSGGPVHYNEHGKTGFLF